MDKASNLQPALFLHIQKTAGTSIVDLARNEYGNENVVSHGDYLGAGQPLSVRSQTADDNPGSKISTEIFDAPDFHQIPFISGHFGYDFAKQFMSGRFFFTFLRDPIERILSYYYFSRTRDPKEYEIYALAQECTLDEFLTLGLSKPALKACIWNNQAWLLAHGYGNSDKRHILMFSDKEILQLAVDHLDDFSYIGFTETFEEDRDVILKALGIALPQQKIISNATPGRPKNPDLPASTMRLLHELTHLDRALYESAWKMFKERGLKQRVAAFLGKLGKWTTRA